eukprot:Rhum_TRINITY_DN15328_c9_g3::Rhum_TRINITY_DN15328_c9_g3_i1::g.152965::m.152965/K17759/AIBP, nnrE; NAD(P)H-hydrate epimerase
MLAKASGRCLTRLPRHFSATASHVCGKMGDEKYEPYFLSQEQARHLDVRLMGPDGGYSVDQLMELAGMSCAVAFECEYKDKAQKVVVVCGPGNNGGDGLVCARHLVQFGYTNVVIVYPVTPKEDSLFARLVHQAVIHGVPVTQTLAASDLVAQDGARAVVVDAMFGFSFRPPLREPYASFVATVAASGCDVVAVDIPTGWHVEKGPTDASALQPSMLVSLTAPKECARHFKGTHYVGGRFVPAGFTEFPIPRYPNGTSPVRKLSAL